MKIYQKVSACVPGFPSILFLICYFFVDTRKNSQYDLLADGSAFDLLETLTDTPLIVITGRGNEEVAVNAMKLGAYDYLIKDLERYYLTVLPLTVATTLKRKQDETDLLLFRQNLGPLRQSVQALYESAQSLHQDPTPA